MPSPDPLARVSRALARLPGIGRRTADRIAPRLATKPAGVLPELIAALQEVEKTVATCDRCGAVTTADENPCSLCTETRRATGVLCVVEEPGEPMEPKRLEAIPWAKLCIKAQELQEQGRL